MIPKYCTKHNYCAQFFKLCRALTARSFSTWRISYEAKIAREMKGHFLLNEHGDLSFLFFCFFFLFFLAIKFARAFVLFGLLLET